MASLAQFDKDIIEAYELFEAKDFRRCLIKCCENIDTPHLGDWWLLLYVLLARCVRERWGDDEEYLYYTAGTTIAALEKAAEVYPSDVDLEDLDRLRDRYERLAILRGEGASKCGVFPKLSMLTRQLWNMTTPIPRV